jgi:hypothetical protein
MKNHFKGATPELLAKALFSKKARKAKTKRTLRRKPRPSGHASSLTRATAPVKSSM